MAIEIDFSKEKQIKLRDLHTCIITEMLQILNIEELPHIVEICFKSNSLENTLGLNEVINISFGEGSTQIIYYKVIDGNNSQVFINVNIGQNRNQESLLLLISTTLALLNRKVGIIHDELRIIEKTKLFMEKDDLKLDVNYYEKLNSLCEFLGFFRKSK